MFAFIQSRENSYVKTVLLLAGLFTACQVADAQRGFLEFEATVIDEDLEGAYGIDIADIDGDGREDIIALTTDPAQLLWYRNPGWEEFSIARSTDSNIDLAPHDIDGDGDTDIVLVSNFDRENFASGGDIHWLENPGNPVTDQEWPKHFIDQLPNAHRAAWAELNGDGRLELIIKPLTGIGAAAPEYDAPLQINAYAIPPDPRMNGWPGIVIDRSLELSHGMKIIDWDNDTRQDLVTVSLGGIHLFQLARRGVTVAKTQIGAGKQEGERPYLGSSEIDIGTTAEGRRFLATIEPWHGNEVVVYNQGMVQLWGREVIDDSLAQGHGLVTADLNNDGADEIIAGGQAEPYRIAIYAHNGTDWQRYGLDQGDISVSGLLARDLNQDGLMDLVAIGAATRNLVYFQNTGR